jgi:hypothetical protein
MTKEAQAETTSKSAFSRFEGRPGRARRPTMLSHPPEMIRPMTRQLELMLKSEDDDWRLDEHTRETGRRGVAEARRVLAEVTRRSAA